jgi:hypothetical protein
MKNTCQNMQEMNVLKQQTKIEELAFQVPEKYNLRSCIRITAYKSAYILAKLLLKRRIFAKSSLRMDGPLS